MLKQYFISQLELCKTTILLTQKGGVNSLLIQEAETLKGSVERITFRNPDNGYSILVVKQAESNQRTTVVGTCIHIHVGSTVVAKGEFKEHPKYGRQFSALSINPVEPDSAEEIERYLSSGAIKGIGESTAKKIVEAFGDKTLETILQEPQKVARVPGVGKAKAQAVAAAFAEQSVLQQILQYLISHRITPGLANKIYSQYGDKAVDLLNEDPYVLARDIRGIGFKRADQIALGGLGLSIDSPHRLKAGLVYTVEKAGEDGHCFLPRQTLIERSKTLLSLDEETELDHYLDKLIKKGTLQAEEENIYTPPLLLAEKVVAQFISERSEVLPQSVVPHEEIQQSIKRAGEELGLLFSEEQKQAAELAAWYRLIVITGGPGCGKTTLIKALSRLFCSAGKKMILAAPTGRAAQRMSQVCNYPASTIHRLLKFGRGGFEHNSDNPLRADVLVVDEASMVDIFLAKALFSAIPASCTLILVGDKDQLPSVGPGRIFADILASPSVQRVFLSQLFRRDDTSTINTIAHLFNAGIAPTIPEPDGNTKVDAYFLPEKDPEQAAELVERLVSDQLPKKFGFNPNDIMVLTPSNRGPLGVQALNKRLQARLNPPLISGGNELTAGDNSTLRLGDRVVQRVNNYNIHEAGVFNGDAGVIYGVDHEAKRLQVDLWDGRIISYTFTETTQLSLAYAMTVHRSQGTEIPCVVLVLHDSHYTMLERQLVYTAVTRAKRLLVIVGTKRALGIAAKRTTALERFSLLGKRIE
jgi:exodeoxyribonuclease V alpha subunit